MKHRRPPDAVASPEGFGRRLLKRTHGWEDPKLNWGAVGVERPVFIDDFGDPGSLCQTVACLASRRPNSS